MNLPLGQVVAGDFREPGRHHSAGKERRELLDDAGAEAQRDQIVLIDSEVSAGRDGGQKLLQGLVLFSLNRLFAVFGFLQAKIVLKAAPHGFVQGELEGLIADPADGYAAEKWVAGGGGIGRLRVNERSRAG